MSKQSTTLRGVVSSDIVCINPLDTLRAAMAAMVENRVSALPVVDARQHCLGVISVTDLLGVTKDLSDELAGLAEADGLDHEALVERLEHADLLTEPVQAWMSSDPIMVSADTTVQHAAQLMLSNSVHRLVVLDDKRHVVGVVSTMDLLAALVDD